MQYLKQNKSTYRNTKSTLMSYNKKNSSKSFLVYSNHILLD